MKNNTILSQQHQGRNTVSYWAFCLNILRCLKLIFTAMCSCTANRFPPCSPTDALYWHSPTRSQNTHARWIDVRGLSAFAATCVNYLLNATQYTSCFVHTSKPRSSRPFFQTFITSIRGENLVNTEKPTVSSLWEPLTMILTTSTTC